MNLPPPLAKRVIPACGLLFEHCGCLPARKMLGRFSWRYAPVLGFFMLMHGHSVDKYVNGWMSQTSSPRCWSGILAERWKHGAGELPSLKPRETEIAVLLHGRTVVDRIGGGDRQFTHGRRGTVWLCPAGVEEEFVNVIEPIEDCLHIFLPGKPFDETVLREFDIDANRIDLRYESIANDTFIEQVAHQILREMLKETSAGKLFIEMLAVSLSAHLVKEYSSARLKKTTTASVDRPLDARRLSRVIDFIDANHDRDFTVADLAAVACLSVAHFSRSFTAAVGATPIAFVSAKRLESAKASLLGANYPIAEIAVAARFSSQANFTRAFRAATGSTPAQYRAAGRRGEHA